MEVASRLFEIKTGKTLDTFTFSARMSWRDYFSRAFTWRFLFRFRPMFSSTDIEKLLNQACYDLISDMRKVA